MATGATVSCAWPSTARPRFCRYSWTVALRRRSIVCRWSPNRSPPCCWKEEMFKQARNCVDVPIGEPVSWVTALPAHPCVIAEKSKLFKRHLYRIGQDKKEHFQYGQRHCPPGKPGLCCEKQSTQCEWLGSTGDGKQILPVPLPARFNDHAGSGPVAGNCLPGGGERYRQPPRTSTGTVILPLLFSSAAVGRGRTGNRRGLPVL